VGGRGAVGERRTAGRRRVEPEAPTSLAAVLELFAGALDVERAALVVEDASGGEHVAAVHGDGPADAAWPVTLEARSAAGTPGRLLLAPRAGRLAAGDAALARRAADGLVELAESSRLATELAHTRDLLARADRLSALGTLAAGIAHEIRNPLVSVRTFIQLLPERLADEEFRTGFRDLALGEIERICALINDLLSFSRPAPATREPTDMNELVAQITRLLDAEARRRDVTIGCRVDADLPPVVVDEAQVKQVLMNVVLNAIQACTPGGGIEVMTGIEAGRGQRWCRLVVADSGAGIAPEHLERIFDPFFTTKDAGSGLGLFIARRIVHAHGGYITASPRSEGGTEFAMHFPLDVRAADAGAS
jgi:signal transduction histidine kinase